MAMQVGTCSLPSVAQPRWSVPSQQENRPNNDVMTANLEANKRSSGAKTEEILFGHCHN